MLKNGKNLIANPRPVEELFVMGHYYFIEIKSINTNKRKIKIYYSGEFFETNKNLYIKLVKFGKKYINSLEKIMKSYNILKLNYL